MKATFCHLVAILALAAGIASGQSFEAILTGQVTDPSRAAIARSRVTVTNISTGRQAIVFTNEDGIFTAAGLAPGAYELSAEHEGFKKFVQRGITLQLDQRARVDIVLSIGVVSEAVEVTAETLLLNSETGAKGQVIDNHEILDLPLNGRDFTELAFLTPGVVDLAEGLSNSGDLTINGGRADGVNFLVDGLSNRNLRNGSSMTQPSVDAVQEFKVQTSAYAADYGTVGSGVINVALKSGTNQFHGTVYEFARNSIFDARNFFDSTKPSLSRHQFGGTIGGPVTLPARLFGPAAYRGKDRTFFFFSFEGLNEQLGDARLARVPTLNDRRGDFSSLLTAARPTYLRDPAASGACDATSRAACFPNNIIPATRFHPLSLKLLNLVPAPNRDGANNFQTSQSSSAKRNDYIVKIDHRWNSRVNLALDYISGNNSSASPYGASNLPGFGLSGAGKNKLLGLRSTQILRSSLTNDARFSFSRTASINDWARRDDAALKDAIQSPLSLSKDPVYAGLIRTTITGFDVIGHHASYPADITVNNFQGFDTLSWVKGKHFLRMGADMIRTQYFQYFPNNARGSMSFLGRVTGGAVTPVPMADFLLGLPENSSVLLDPRKNYLLYTNAAAFIQDDFKATSRLTLNFGLRYDFLSNPIEKQNKLSSFVPELKRVAVAGEPGLPRSLVNNRYKNFAPRVGFAWRPNGTERWVVRGGYGLFYTNTAQNSIRILLANNVPYSSSRNFLRSTTDPFAFTIANPFPFDAAGTIASTNPTGASLYSPTPYMQNYNFTIERQIGTRTVAELSYVGSRGRGLPRKYDINQQIRTNPAAVVRPFPQYNGAIQFVGFASRSDYHSLQATLRRSFRNGVGFRANFVWSKSIDDTSGVTGTGSEGAAQDSTNLQLERGLSGFNRPRAFTLDYSYLLPFARKNPFFGGWQLNGIVRLYDGQPFTPGVSTFNFAAGGASRPDRIGNGNSSNPTVERWFNVADFVPVPTGSFRFGNAGRGILNGPPRRQIDLSLMKNFLLPAEQRLQFRAEVFNAPNVADFFLPVANVDVTNAGTITRARPGRTIQFGLKYIF